VERDHLLSVRRPCGHTGAFHSSGVVPFLSGIALRTGCKMGPKLPRVHAVGWARSVVHRPGAIPGWVQVYTLYRVIRSVAIAASSVMDEPSGLLVLMFWHFYLPPVIVSRGCSRLEERGSIYLVDPIAIIEVRGEGVLASILDRSRLWRQGPE
jgi:hypothetical protein